MKNLVESIEAFNADEMPVYISVPSQDRQLFLKHIGSGRCEWLDDEDIISANPRMSWQQIQQMDPRKAQQVIKSEFWRVQPCVGYLCMDSDSMFIRDFYGTDFLAPDGVPYTSIHQNKELLQLAINSGRAKFAEDFKQECAIAKSIFGRVGPDYDFGPTPVIWASKVWQDLDVQYLQPRGMNLVDAINEFPSELRWYGEALLAYQSIPLRPIEPLFRVYHADWQYFRHLKMGETLDKLRQNFLGVVMQSNWHYEMDFGSGGRSPLSLAARRIKRHLGRLR